MKTRLAISALYGLLLVALAVSSARPSSLPSLSTVSQTQQPRLTIKFDMNGRRGLVLFDHKRHEAEINPDPSFPHRAASGVACTGCHHTVEKLTVANQFQKCSTCHKEEGNPDNREDKQGIELNSREIFHRL